MKKLFIVSVLSYSLNCLAAPSIGTVLVAVNKVNAGQRTLSRGSAIYNGDTIVTGDNSQAKIKYTNGSLISIGANSHYQTQSYSASKTDSSFKANLSSGSLEYKSSGKKKGTIKTPVVALAILGTELKAIVTPTNTYLQVDQGLVQGGAQLLGPGQQFNSGKFDQNQHFTPGAIPWKSPDASNSASNHSINSNTLSTLTELTSSINGNIAITTSVNSVNSMVMAAMSNQIAGIALIGCN